MMRLAMSLGWSLQDVRQHMTCAEIQWWRAYSQVEPFGEERADMRAANVVSVIAACLGIKVSPEQLITGPDIGPVGTRQQSVEEMQARIKGAFGVMDKRKGT